MKVDKNKIYLKEDDFYRVLDVDGNLINKNYKTKATKEQLLKAYEMMVLSRQQDSLMIQLQRQGRMLTFAPNFGEEALQAAMAMPLQKDDWFVPSFRPNVQMLYLGVPIENQFYYWNGNEKGSVMPEGVNVLPINIPIATQCTHAAGIAYAMKLKGKKSISVSIIGNGGTAEGEFYEALNVSAIHKWPSVFCINNNQWAISTPNHLESVSGTLAAKAVAAGMAALRVDGNDLLASFEVMAAAADYARSGKGPILVEFITWRQGPHTTSDDPRVYRTEEMEKEHEKWEPFHRIEKYLIDQKLLTKDKIKAIWDEKLAVVKEAFEKTSKDIDTKFDDIFDYTYEQLTPELKEQKEELSKMLGGGQ